MLHQYSHQIFKVYKKPFKLYNNTGTFLVNWKIDVPTPMRSTYKSSCYVAVISYFFIFNEFSQIQQMLLDWNCYDHGFVEMCFHYFFTVFVLFKNCFNKFLTSIFTSVNGNWFTKFIIDPNKFVSKTTRNVTLIFFWARTFITFKIV